MTFLWPAFIINGKSGDLLFLWVKHSPGFQEDLRKKRKSSLNAILFKACAEKLCYEYVC